MSKPEDSPYICWIDLETDGNQDTNTIIEIGAVMTDREMNELDFKQIVLYFDRAWRGMLDPVVLDMHTKNGLLNECDESEILPSDADDMMVAWIKQFTKGGHIPLAGSGVSHFDRRFIERELPKLIKYLTYWHYDVGTFRRMLKLFEIPLTYEYAAKDGLTHRGLDDIRAHIEESKSYRDQLRAYFFPGPARSLGPQYPSSWALDSSGTPI